MTTTQLPGVPVLVAHPSRALLEHAVRYRAGCNCPRTPTPLGPTWPVPAAAYLVRHQPRCHPRSLIDYRFILLIAPGARRPPTPPPPAPRPPADPPSRDW